MLLLAQRPALAPRQRAWGMGASKEVWGKCVCVLVSVMELSQPPSENKGGGCCDSL